MVWIKLALRYTRLAYFGSSSLFCVAWISGLDPNLYRNLHSGGKPSHPRKLTSASPKIPPATISSHTSKVALVPLFNSSPVVSCKTGSTSMIKIIKYNHNIIIIIIVIFDEGAKLAIRVFSAQGPYTCRQS